MQSHDTNGQQLDYILSSFLLSWPDLTNLQMYAPRTGSENYIDTNHDYRPRSNESHVSNASTTPSVHRRHHQNPPSNASTSSTSIVRPFDMDSKDSDMSISASLRHPISLRLRSPQLANSPFLPQRLQEQSVDPHSYLHLNQQHHASAVAATSPTQQPLFHTPTVGDRKHYDTGRLNHKDLRINISASMQNDFASSNPGSNGGNGTGGGGGVLSPSRSIVQLYELEYDRMKSKCARAETALGESYRSLDKLNDLIVATDTSKQLASSTSVNALLDFFHQVSCWHCCFLFCCCLLFLHSQEMFLDSDMQTCVGCGCFGLLIYASLDWCC